MGAAEKIEGERVPFPLNPRRVSEEDPTVIALAEDMKRRGQITDIIVRTVDDGDTWQVLAGNRRLVAARLAELPTLNAIIRRDLYEDDEALELCLAEQLQHEDLAPLEEADSLAELLRTMPRGTTIAALASRVGKRERQVRERLALRHITSEIRALADRIDEGALQALAALSDVAQSRIAKRLAKVLEHEDRITRRIVSDIVEHEKVTRSLKQVAWSLTDAELVPEAGACSVCPKRTGQGSLIDDVVGATDTCLDDACYADKGSAQWERTAKEERAHGAKVLSAKDSKLALDEHGRPKPDAAYVAAREKLPVGDKYIPAENLLAARGVGYVVAQHPETREPIRLYPRKDVDAAVKEAKTEHAERSKKKAAAKAAPATPKKVDPKRAEAEAKERNAEAVDELTTSLVLEAAYQDGAGRLAAPTILLRVLLYLLMEVSYGREPLLVARRRGLAGASDERKDSKKAEAKIEELARSLAKRGEDREMLALTYEVLVALILEDSRTTDLELKKSLNLDRVALRKAAEKRLSDQRFDANQATKVVAKPKKGTARK